MIDRYWRTFWLLAALILLAVVLVGCGGGGDGDPPCENCAENGHVPPAPPIVCNTDPRPLACL